MTSASWKESNWRQWLQGAKLRVSYPNPSYSDGVQQFKSRALKQHESFDCINLFVVYKKGEEKAGSC